MLKCTHGITIASADYVAGDGLWYGTRHIEADVGAFQLVIYWHWKMKENGRSWLEDARI